MSPALVIGHPTTLVVSLLLIPVTLFLSVVLPGNQFLPLASLAGMFYLFPAVLPVTKGNVLKTFIIGLVALIVGLYFCNRSCAVLYTGCSGCLAKTGDSAVKYPKDSREEHSTSLQACSHGSFSIWYITLKSSVQLFW